MNKLVSFGEVLVDQIMLDRHTSKHTYEHTSSLRYAGGAPANVAVCYSKLGGNSVFVGGLGSDDNAMFLQRELQKYEVDTSQLKIFIAAKTAIAIITLDKDNDRSFEIFRDKTADTLFTRKHFDPTLFQQALFFHFCSNTLTQQSLYDATEHGIELASTNELIISFDVNLRFDLWHDDSTIEALVSRIMIRCDIIKMSLCELEFLAGFAGKSNIQYINSCFIFDVTVILITDGENDLDCYTKSDKLSLKPPKVKPEDTTAAGDAFIGGFLQHLSSLVDNRKDFKRLCLSTQKLKNALSFAACCGAMTCCSKGAFSSLPNKREVEQFMVSAN